MFRATLSAILCVFPAESIGRDSAAFSAAHAMMQLMQSNTPLILPNHPRPCVRISVPIPSSGCTVQERDAAQMADDDLTVQLNEMASQMKKNRNKIEEQERMLTVSSNAHCSMYGPEKIQETHSRTIYFDLSYQQQS